MYRCVISDLTFALRLIYRNPADLGGFGGVDRLLRRARRLGVARDAQFRPQVSRGREFVYALFFCAQALPAQPHLHDGINIISKLNLAEMQGISRQNNGVQYLLFVIDVVSKLA